MRKLYAIFDKKSGEYFALATWASDELFKRSIIPEVNVSDERNIFSRFPCDFDLYCLGTFDPRTGVVMSDVTFICSAADLKEV